MEKTAAKWEFRELCSSDIFPVFRIVSKIGFKQFRDCFQSEDVKNMAAKGGKKDVSAIGMQQSQNRFDRCCFACSVFTDESYNGAGYRDGKYIFL